jgi:dolichyl-phosphate beta-glucosyltransferase
VARPGTPGSDLGAGRPVLLEIVVPAYNEAERLPRGLGLLCGELQALGVSASVIVVDNGSTDGTAAIVSAWSGPVPVRLLHCSERGKGAAVRMGLLATTAPYVGFCDADMATDLGRLGDVLGLLGSGRHVVVGSRRHPGSVVAPNHNPLRRLGAITFNLLSRDLAGGITDTQCGFKFFAGPLARAASADLRTTGFVFDVELLMHCRRRGVQIREVPVRWRDVEGSTFSVRRHSLVCLRDLLRIRLYAVTMVPVNQHALPSAAPRGLSTASGRLAEPHGASAG